MIADRAIELRRTEERRFGQMIGLSTGLHGVFFSLLLLWKATAPVEPLIKRDEAIEVDLIMASASGSAPKLSNRLPNKATHVPLPASEPPSPEAATAPVPKPATSQEAEKPPETKVAKAEAPREAKSIEDAMKPDSTKNTPPPDPGLDEAAREAMARRVAMLNLKDRVAKVDGEEGRRNRDATSSGGVRGGGGSGRSGNVGQDGAWGDALNARISEVWVTLPTLREQKLLVEVFVRIDAEGNIVPDDVKVVKESGSRSFDESAVRAIKKARSLPLPSREDVRRAVLAEGFILVFNPKGMNK